MLEHPVRLFAYRLSMGQFAVAAAITATAVIRDVVTFIGGKVIGRVIVACHMKYPPVCKGFACGVFPLAVTIVYQIMS